MNYVAKLNVASILYGIGAWVMVECMLNVYRISRISGWDISNVTNSMMILLIISVGIFTFIYSRYTKNHLGARKSRYVTTILWVPYFSLFVYGFRVLFPMVDRGDLPPPIVGLVIMAGLVVYPIYIALVTMLSMNNEKGMD